MEQSDDARSLRFELIFDRPQRERRRHRVAAPLGTFVDQAVEAVRGRLKEGTCIEQRNAAKMLSYLLPPDLPPELEDVVLGDGCDEAKAAAWRAIGLLGHPEITDLIVRREAAEGQAPSVEVRLGMIEGLGNVHYSYVLETLERLSRAEESEVAEAAAKTHEDLVTGEEETRKLLANLGSAQPEAKADMTAVLERSLQSAELDFSGSALELEARVDPEDLELLNAARASVLRRQSDECVYEFGKLFLGGMLARQMLVNREGP